MPNGLVLYAVDEKGEHIFEHFWATLEGGCFFQLFEGKKKTCV